MDGERSDHEMIISRNDDILIAMQTMISRIISRVPTFVAYLRDELHSDQ